MFYPGGDACDVTNMPGHARRLPSCTPCWRREEATQSDISLESESFRPDQQHTMPRLDYYSSQLRSRNLYNRRENILSDQLYGGLYAVCSAPLAPQPSKLTEHRVIYERKTDVTHVLMRVAEKLESSIVDNGKPLQAEYLPPYDLTSVELSPRFSRTNAEVHVDGRVASGSTTFDADLGGCRPTCHCRNNRDLPLRQSGPLLSDQTYTTQVGPPSSGQDADSSDHSSFFSISTPCSSSSSSGSYQIHSDMTHGLSATQREDLLVHYEPQSSSSYGNGSPFDSSSIAGDATYNIALPCLTLPSYLLEDRSCDQAADEDTRVDSDTSSFFHKPLAVHGVTHNASYRKSAVVKLLQRVGRKVTESSERQKISVETLGVV